MRRTAQVLADDGLAVDTTSLLTDKIDAEPWDLIILDLDGLDSFLRGVLPLLEEIAGPKMVVVGMSRRSEADGKYMADLLGLKLDAVTVGVPRPEELIVRFPRLASRILADTGPLKPPTGPLGASPAPAV
ncbi:MAG: hypothetical protein D6784_08060 [Chloroflexi bacterium]|nr:MAG: hypothetical protein D6784_08060 [Chloroflexota bacterium]